MPVEFPERGEAGTLPTPAIAGLCEGIKYIRQIGTEEIAAHENRLFAQLKERLQALPNFHMMLPEYSGSTLMFYRKGTSSDKIGAYLASKGICLRTGYHCAALGHRTLGTPDGGGVRISTGVFNRSCDIEILYRTLKEMEHGYEITQEHP
jgi:selenocysteine lyase/cysteine desulfurase